MVMNFLKKKGLLLSYKGIKIGFYHPNHCRKHHILVLQHARGGRKWTNMLEFGCDGGRRGNLDNIQKNTFFVGRCSLMW